MRIPTDLTEERILAVKIRECEERLVDIKKGCPSILIHESLYKNGSKPLVRMTIAKMLEKARTYLPGNITIIVRDALRPLQVQRKFYRESEKMFRKQYPNWSSEKIRKEVNKYVADPESQIPPAHSTGAAVDVSLAYVKTGRRLPMKFRKLSYQKQSMIDSKGLPRNIIENRRILYNVMTKVGFVNYPYEWWHYSYGETFAVARKNGREAVYGKIDGDFE